MYHHKIACTVAVTLIFITTLVIVSSHGRNNRGIAPGNSLVTIDSPDKAYAIWNEKKAKGRTLLLFDSFPHAGGLISYNGPPYLTSTNLIEFSIFKNIIRKIYFIVPDADWEKFQYQKAIIPIREVTGSDRGLYLYNLNGIPFIVTTPTALPHIAEEVLVYVNDRVFTPQLVRDTLSQKNITSDITITYQQGSAR